MAQTPSSQTKIVVPGAHSMVSLLGSRDELLRVVERAFRSDIHVRGNEITVTGDPEETELVSRLFEELLALLDRGDVLTADAVERSVAMIRSGADERPADVLTLNILSTRGRTIRPKTLNQKRYVDAIDAHTVVFSIGPAGTGKTYLAMAKAVRALQAREVNRIILTRPAVEAGERLGFLPGTLYEKIDPYLRPLYDALHDMIDPESIPRLMAAGTIEVAPLAYMRGRASPLDTPVLTPTGFRPIGSLRVGDLVTGSDGLPTPVLGVYPQGRKQVYRLTTQDGASALACAEHLWAVSTRQDRRSGSPGRVVRTADMIGRLRAGHRHNFQLPIVAPVEFEPRDVPLDPYAVGRFLADGTTVPSPSDGTTVPSLADGTTVPGPSDGPRGAVMVASPAVAALRDLGLTGTGPASRSVPGPYLHNTAAVRLALLQGLLDTSGRTVGQPGRVRRVRYTTCSPRLRDDVVFLARSLGGIAYLRRHPSGAHILDISLPRGLAPFRLQSKRDRYAEASADQPVRFVESIEPAGESDCVCIAVAAADSLYVTSDFLVTHNTLNDAFIILDEAQNTSPEQMKMFLTRLGFGSKMVVTGDVTQVDLPAGTRSGLRVVQEILEGVEDVHFATLSSRDVVRHKLVSDIVDAYARFDANQVSSGQQRASRRPGRSGRS